MNNNEVIEITDKIANISSSQLSIDKIIELCLEVVKQDGNEIRNIKWHEFNFTKEQALMICVEAVKSKREAITYIKWPELKYKFSDNDINLILDCVA
ncbi:hypothetical protein [Clostridioides difficile]|uniref:hypothetical protein n=1 Tax=Clostridioides TaxID=1870884 RepID=UPI000BB1EB36|nr:hypothetical protein [Clostridioides difficile]MCC0671827.1 hypothetical protein [Clostridioides sp. ES-S-0145-01]MCC0682231.1 hypothetical protein [Clostridioides sp. ES-S-0005-03]MCC0705540.1 hypothetical protein [Clostridioides sp. ES-S-0190-01]UDN64156.1 hypothetical protein IC758_20010 [Clostridioides sp. ES-W-0016-02]ELX4552729.1 hypothetical protein [Clostridioides difficile]